MIKEMQKKYDYLIVGSGLFGATFVNLATMQDKKYLIIDKSHNRGGNIYYVHTRIPFTKGRKAAIYAHKNGVRFPYQQQ